MKHRLRRSVQLLSPDGKPVTSWILQVAGFTRINANKQQAIE
jgi:hypothetical protein